MNYCKSIKHIFNENEIPQFKLVKHLIKYIIKLFDNKTNLHEQRLIQWCVPINKITINLYVIMFIVLFCSLIKAILQFKITQDFLQQFISIWMES